MTFDLRSFQNALVRLFGRVRNQSLAKAARLERDALLQWLDTSEEGLFDREAEDRMSFFSHEKRSGETVRVLRRDRRAIVPGEIAAIFNVKLVSGGPQMREIPVGELVPGDLVVLSEGDVVPMDVRLLSCDDFHVCSSGSMTVRKYAGVCEGADSLDFPNIALCGMTVVRGSAYAVVVSGAPIPSRKPVFSRETENLLPSYGFLVPQR